MKNNGSTTIAICLGTGGIAAGGIEVWEAFDEGIKKNKLAAGTTKRKCKTRRTGCRGNCAKDVLVDVVSPEGEKLTYQRVTAAMVPEIIEKHIIGNEPVTKWLTKDDYRLFNEQQQRLVLGNCGEIDPENIDEYIEQEGYKALEKVVKEMTPQQVIDEVQDSGLRGRGGGGFETGWKWGSCAKYDADQKFILCNADEGDPGAFMDRSLLEGDPHAVIEGMVIAGYAIAATDGYIYCRAEYPLAIKRLNIAIPQAVERGFLGDNICGSGYSLHIKIKEGAGAFVCGESTALQYSIEGKRGMPRTRPPQSVEAGLWDKPSCLNNVETFGNVPAIIRKGAKWFAAIGTEKSKGTKIFALAGNIKNTGLIEVPMGTTIRQVVFDIGGGIPGRKKFKAVQIGGPSGGCLPESCLDTPIDFESLTDLGAMMGSGSLVVVDETACMVELSKFFINFCAAESCGKCVPCRVGTTIMLEILENITNGKGKEGDIELLAELAEEIGTMSLCGLGSSAPQPVLSTIRYFRDEYEAHIKDKVCSTATCVPLRKYEINTEKCTKCGACFKGCPTGAIEWEKGKISYLNKEKCVKCGSCYTKCSFMAIK
ncbi:MAG: NADH-ubiquinone oxidoreductase-F iron-sulfur binding region domain-containing protein [Candidatus Anammoxibacter sp.]